MEEELAAEDVCRPDAPGCIDVGADSNRREPGVDHVVVVAAARDQGVEDRGNCRSVTDVLTDRRPGIDKGRNVAVGEVAAVSHLLGPPACVVVELGVGGQAGTPTEERRPLIFERKSDSAGAEKLPATVAAVVVVTGAAVVVVAGGAVVVTGATVVVAAGAVVVVDGW